MMANMQRPFHGRTRTLLLKGKQLQQLEATGNQSSAAKDEHLRECYNQEVDFRVKEQAPCHQNNSSESEGDNTDILGGTVTWRVIEPRCFFSKLFF